MHRKLSCSLRFSPKWLILLAVACLYSGSNCAQLPHIKLHSAKLPPTSESFLFGKQQQISYLYICSSSTVMTLMEQCIQCCKMEFGEDMQQARKMLLAAPTLLSSPQPPLISPRQDFPSSPYSHITYTCNFAHRRRLQSSGANLGSSVVLCLCWFF